jgi:hypothetical protein
MIKNLLAFILIWLSTISLYANDVAYVKFNDKKLTIGNNFIERVIEIQPQKVATTQILNKISGSVYNVNSEEFALSVVFSSLGPAFSKLQNGENPVLLTSTDFQYQGYKIKDLYEKGKELTLEYKFNHDITAFNVNVNYDIYPDNHYMKKWIEISDSSDGIEFLDKLYLESFTFENKDLSHGQFGQPVFNKDIFFGVEYPTTENIIEEGRVMNGYVVGQKITKDIYTSYSSVIGVSSSAAKLEQTFMKYVDHIKIKGTRSYLLYNSWYDLRRPELVQESGSLMNEKNVLDRIKSIEKFSNDYKIKFDTFLLDDGWERLNSLWGIDSTRFPNGFKPIVNALNRMNTSLGLWASPFGGYEFRDQRTKWAAEHGYETTGEFICFAGNKYKAAMKNAMVQYTKDDNIGYFKWDGFLLSCNEVNHGHLPGLYSREAFVSTYIEMMKAVRAENPNIYLNITSGTWLSPWWLKYADCIWMQGADYGYAEEMPSINDRDKAISLKDTVLWDNFQKQHLLFPMSSLMTHGIIKGRLNLLGGENESLESFSNEVMMYFGRGVMMWELYVTPNLLSENEWNAIASSIKWAKANKEVLENTKMILGNPLKKEIYGYLHSTSEKSILLLRNPNVEARVTKIKLTADLGDFDPLAEYFVKIIYPYNMILPKPVRLNQDLSINMGGYEVLTAELIPFDKIDKNLPIGVKYSVENGNLFVYGIPGENEIIESIGKKELAKVQFGNKVVNIEYGKNVSVKNNGMEFDSQLTINIPNQYKNAKFAFLLESDQILSDKLKPDFIIKINGINTKLKIEEGQGKWFWVSTILSPGINNIDYSVNFKENEKGNISSWLLSDKELSGKKIPDSFINDNEILPAKPYQANIQKEFTFLKNYKIY